MISLRCVKNYCKDDISLIENYAKAIADTEQIWSCHHRRELETPRKKLIEIGEYLNRPASELIFLTHSEHIALHKKGVHHTEEAKRKIAETKKGTILTEEHKIKLSEAHFGKHWFNNGIAEVFVKECPEGFVRGRLKKVKQS